MNQAQVRATLEVMADLDQKTPWEWEIKNVGIHKVQLYANDVTAVDYDGTDKSIVEATIARDGQILDFNGRLNGQTISGDDVQEFVTGIQAYLQEESRLHADRADLYREKAIAIEGIINGNTEGGSIEK